MASLFVTRGEFLKIAGLSLAASTLGVVGGARAAEPVLGLMFPPAARDLPEEAKLMYPTGVKWVLTGLGLGQLTPEGYESVVPKVGGAAKELRDKGAQGVVLMGSSLSFYKGAEFNRQLTQSMRDASGIPCITQSIALVESLKHVGAKRLAVATAYTNEVNRRLEIFLKESGFEVELIKGMDLISLTAAEAATEEDVRKLAVAVLGSVKTADTLLISCGGLNTLRIHVELEKRFNLPVVASTPAGLWAGVRMMDLSGKVPGLGRALA